MRDVPGVEAAWTKIIGVLLILLGLALCASPQIRYNTREELPNTPLSVKREKTAVIPRPVALLIMGAGVTVLILAGRKPHS
ncbi:MAG: hypothetical protein ACREMQ_23490 [Longimicrobiales bacterium]